MNSLNNRGNNILVVKTKKLLWLLVISISTLSCSEKNKMTKIEMQYPNTKKSKHVDIYFDTEVQDPYRWLEDDMSDETKVWVKEQNTLTEGYLGKIDFRNALRDRIESLLDYERISAPRKHGDYIYYYQNDGLQNQDVLYRTLGENGEESVFINPNLFSEKGTVSMAGTSFSKDGSLCAYLISEGGSDWRKCIVISTQTLEVIEDTLVDIKFSGIAWRGNEGFYYSSYDKPKDESELSGKTQFHKLFYHQIGEPQGSDELIFGGEKTPRRYISGYLTESEEFLVITAAESTSGNELYVQDLREGNHEIVCMVKGFEKDHYVIDNDGSTLLLSTNLEAPNNRIMKVDCKDPVIGIWAELISETENVLHAGTAGGHIFASYMEDVKSKVLEYDYNGKLVRVVDIPGMGTIKGMGGDKDENYFYYSFTSLINPPTTYKYDILSGLSAIHKEPNIDFDSGDYITKQVFYKSKDGTSIPMYIVHRKDVILDGNNPTWLYSYGGFNISLMPSFSTSRIVWLENGGVYAQPNIRGGGEYGEEWHVAGIKLEKQNVFDDFISAAEYLVEEGYTNSDRLAIEGRSNGGLLVGAVMAQRPSLARVAFPGVGVMDMLRYHKFTAGAGWSFDYGTSDDSKEMFEYLYRYSPVHAIRKNQSYPATLVTTADHDDRVVPAHSFKFISHMQTSQLGESPVLISIETDAGHGAGTPISKVIDQLTDKYAFAWHNMDFKPKY
ncbi:MAG: S9 family peptidase [Flavobacteriales bacterium]|nr:S9 family peptidase [Flavobacteriales bacterium]